MDESRGNSVVNGREWIFNKPSPPWIGSCSKREAENFGVCGYGRPPLRQIWRVCMWQTLFDLELGLASAEIFGLGEKRHVVERIRANRYKRNPVFLILGQA